MKITSQNRTSDSYRFTVRMVNGQVAPEDQEVVSQLRALIKNRNAEYSKYRFSGNPLYVKLQGRGPRASQSRRDYGYSRGYDQGLPLSIADTADVYVYERRS